MKFNFLKALNENFRIKVFALFIVIILIISLAYSVFFIKDQNKRVANELIKNGSLLAGILAHNSRIGVFSENESLLNIPVEAVFKQEDVFEVSVFNRKGELLIERKKPRSMFIEASVKEDSGRSAKRILEKFNRIGFPYSDQGRKKIEFWSPVISGPNYTMEEALFFQENPLQNKKSIIGLVKVSVDKKRMKKNAIGISMKSVLIGIIFLIVGSGATYFVSRRITRPLDRLTEGVNALEAGGVFRKVPVETVDEIGRLAEAFNNMSDSLVNRENALMESESRYRNLVENVNDMIWEVDEKSIYTYVSPQSVGVLGYEPEALLGKAPFDFMQYRDRKWVSEMFLDLLATSKSFSTLVVEKISKDGSIIWVESSGMPFFDADGKLLGFRGTERNITDRIHAEAALRQEKERAQQYLDIAGVMIVALNRESRVTLINKKGCDLLGCKEEEALGKDWFLNFLPVRVQEKVKSLSLRVLAEESGSLNYFENPVLTREGNERLIAWHNTILKDKDGNIFGLLSSGEDITEKKVAEFELRESREQLRNLSRYLQSSMENERARISREIHDDLGQYLTVLKMDLSWLKRRLPKDQHHLHEKERAMRTSLDIAIDSVERIVSNLRPGPLEDLGLIAALEWLIGWFQDQTGITCRYSFDQEEYGLGSARAIAIYRILQESLTNIARHSNATGVDIDLYHDSGSIVLKVLDNGIGISKNSGFNPGSFGLVGMQERAYLFQGKVEIEGGRDKGTVITASIPVEG